MDANLDMDLWVEEGKSGSRDVYGDGGSCGDQNVTELKTLKD